MNIESIREICLSLLAATEDIKWGNDLCFSIGAKMFCVAGLQSPLSVSFKVGEAEFADLSVLKGCRPAPYTAKYNWILVEDMHVFTAAEWKQRIAQSYALVRAKLPKKISEKLPPV